jgi:hypothetical protein
MEENQNKKNSPELVKLRSERQRYYNKLNKELTFIREWMLPILEDRAKKYSNPLVFAKYVFKKEDFSRLNLLKDKIYSTKDCFKERYEVLREIYKGRFGHFDEKSLFKKYESMVNRKNDLRKRAEKVKNIKENASIFEQKRAKKILENVVEELERRERAINDVLVEFGRRKINLEHYYTNVIELNLKKDKYKNEN